MQKGVCRRVGKELLSERICCQKGVVVRKELLPEKEMLSDRRSFVVEELLSVQLSVCCQKCRKELMRKEFVGKEL